MSIIGLLVLLIIIGVALWAVNVKVPMDSVIKTILNVVVILIVLLLVLNAFGLMQLVGRVPQVR